ncbi:MAG: energy transducer TonB [Sphingobacteriales bacterium]|nr:MAG: energy transducer TonB [Sphingobacteriales bacterium]
MTFTAILLLLSPFLLLGLFRLFFSFRSSESLMKKYSGKPVSFLQRKYPEADIQNFRSIFQKVSLALSLLLVLYAFNYSTQKAEVKALTGDFVFEDDIEILPPQVAPPPKLAPPPPPPKIEIVEDKEILEDSPDLANLEADENTVIELVELPADVGEIELPKAVEQPKIIKEEEPEVFVIVEQMPEFPGGQTDLFKFLASNTHYPAMARENGIEGTVYVGFVVMEDGSISQVHIKRGLPGGGAGIDEEALRVVNLMPKWKPGMQRGKKVRVAYTLPFKFKLD